MKCLLQFLLLAGVLSILSRAMAENQTLITTNGVAKPTEIPGIHNAFRVTEKIYSGSQPEGDAAFAALEKFGIKTIVSVDGSKPDVDAARKHGFRYVHLPFGYAGVPTNRIAELARLTAELNGPFFVHCHHGLHRGPAAVAIMCEASEGWTPDRANAWLQQAGTAADYPGLYRSAREFKMPNVAELAAVKELPEIAEPSSLVEAMLQIDSHLDWLKQSQKSGWKVPPDHADISPEHEATMLWEQFTEMIRTEDTKQRPEDFRARLTDAQRATDALRKLLKDSPEQSAIDAQFKVATQTCSACHKKYRNQ
jgi:protein tyrosine phosphatase (PTP) superfamily phosphohydrolase (DUF442 family)